MRTPQNKTSEIRFHELELRRIESAKDCGNLYHRLLLEKLRRYLKFDVNTDRLIFDAGCGDGFYVKKLAQEDYNVVGLDISPAYARFWKPNYKGKKGTSMFVIGDLEKIPFRDKSFDACFCISTLHHFVDISLVCSELSRTMKYQGKFFLIDINGSNPFIGLTRSFIRFIGSWLEKMAVASKNECSHNISGIAKELRKSGFKNLRASSVYIDTLELYEAAGTGRALLFSRSFLIYFFRLMEHIVLELCWRILPQPLNGYLLVISTIKTQRYHKGTSEAHDNIALY